MRNEVSPASVHEAPAPLAMSSEDVAAYRQELAGLALTEDQANELLATLWSIMTGFVELGFDVGLIDPCGQILDGFNQVSGAGTEGVFSEQHSNEETDTEEAP